MAYTPSWRSALTTEEQLPVGEQRRVAAWYGAMFGSHHADSKVLLTFVGTAASLLAIFWLGSEVLEGDVFALDKVILRALRTAGDSGVPIGPHWLRWTAIDITALGGVTVLTLITIFVVGFLLAIRKQSMALYVAAAVASGALVSSGLKSIFVRPRPELVPHLVEVSSTSFPSGHAMNSAMVYLTLAALLARSQQQRSVRVYLIVIAMALTLMVGMTRVYLGVHWPSDVLAGWCIGAVWAVICSTVAKLLQRKRKIEQPSPANGNGA